MTPRRAPQNRPQTPQGAFRQSTAPERVRGPATPLDAATPAPRFATLFTDPRHYRGDLRMMRTAVRRGWLDAVPQADRDALEDRFEQATAERKGMPFASDGVRLRAVLGEIRVALALEAPDLEAGAAALRWRLTGDAKPRPGRPRERWRVSDYTRRIDANELRRRAKAEGLDLRSLHAMEVRPEGLPDDAACGGERIALAVAADARYGWRVWLVCPCCTRRRVYLYPVRAGARCRKCAGIGYAGG